MADVYSFAMVCYEILSGKESFEGHLPKSSFLIGVDGLQLITSCWDAVPERRPTFDEICARLLVRA